MPASSVLHCARHHGHSQWRARPGPEAFLQTGSIRGCILPSKHLKDPCLRTVCTRAAPNGCPKHRLSPLTPSRKILQPEPAACSAATPVGCGTHVRWSSDLRRNREHASSILVMPPLVMKHTPRNSQACSLPNTVRARSHPSAARSAEASSQILPPSGSPRRPPGRYQQEYSMGRMIRQRRSPRSGPLGHRPMHYMSRSVPSLLCPSLPRSG